MTNISNGLLGFMLSFEELDGALSKIGDLAYLSFDFSGVSGVELAQYFRIRVRVWMEDVVPFL